MSDGSVTLLSDTRKRVDVGPMVDKNWEEADVNKLALEELQRADAKLRAETKARREAAEAEENPY